MSSPAADRIAALRELLTREGIAALLVPSSDPHLSEYLPLRWQGRAWASGFSGSVGTLIVTPTFAGLWVDSRYTAQADRELAGSGITRMSLPASGSVARIISARSCQVKGFLALRAWKAEPRTTIARPADPSARASSAAWPLWKGWKRPMRTAASKRGGALVALAETADVAFMAGSVVWPAFAGGSGPGAGGEGSPADAPGSGLTVEEALWVLGFSSGEEYAAWLAAATDEEAVASALMLAALLGGG